MSDVMDHLLDANEDLTFAEHDLEASAQLYTTRVSMEMAAANNVMASNMQSLSLVATIMLPMSLVAGLFGMNVKVRL